MICTTKCIYSIYSGCTRSEEIIDASAALVIIERGALICVRGEESRFHEVSRESIGK